MNRLLVMLVFLVPGVSGTVVAQTAAPDSNSASPAPDSSESRPPGAFDSRVEREQIKREILDDVRKSLEKQKEEIRYEVRAQSAAQAASRDLEEEFQDEKKKLELFELDGYFRVRPQLFYNFDLRRNADPNGYQLFYRPSGDRQTLAGTNMRWRLDPRLNVTEDVRIFARIDILDNLVLGSTPEGGFGVSERTAWAVASEGQVPPVADRNSVSDSITVRQVYGDVNTPFGRFLFGRMGNQWGMGMLANCGSDIDSDYGDTVDRLAFIAKVSDYYIMPMLTFAAIGPTSANNTDPETPPFDLDELDDAIDYGISIARRDTDSDIRRKFETNHPVLNYGLYFTYRNQSNDAAAFFNGDNPYQNQAGETVARKANIFITDVWVKYQTRKLRLELETAAVLGSMVVAQTPGDNPKVDIRQFGAVAQGEYGVSKDLQLGLEVGFASGDRASGMGNLPGRKPTKPGSIDGPQYCVASNCEKRDADIRNFRFNRAYKVDLILWSELFNGVTDAIYVKPGVKYEIADGFRLWANIVYSRAIYGESTPSSHVDNGALKGDPNLGVEIDGGLRFDSGDGFLAGVSYGVLFPLSGLDNNIGESVSAKSAHAVQGWFGIQY